MGKTDDKIKVSGVVVDVNTGVYKVKLDDKISLNHIVNTTLSGKMRINKIKVLQGDEVILLISPYDLTRGIIIERKKK